MTRAIAERIPLHSLAISIVTLGKVNDKPCRITGVRVAWKIQLVTSPEPHCSQRMIRSTADTGSGIIRRRKSSGKTPARNAQSPQTHENPDHTRNKKPTIASASEPSPEIDLPNCQVNMRRIAAIPKDRKSTRLNS